MKEDSPSESSPSERKRKDAKPHQAGWQRTLVYLFGFFFRAPLVSGLNRNAWLILAAVGAAVAIVGGFFAPIPDVSAEPQPDATFWMWLKTPLEFNRDLQLANFGDLEIESVAVASNQNGEERLFVAGRNAFVAYSDDRGRSWTRVYYDRSTGGFAIAGMRAPVPAAAVTSGEGAEQQRQDNNPGGAGAGQTQAPPANKSSPPKQSPAQTRPPLEQRPQAKGPAPASWFFLVPSVWASEKKKDTSQSTSNRSTAASGGGSSPLAAATPRSVAAICVTDDGALALVLDEERAAVSRDFGQTWQVTSLAALMETAPFLTTLDLRSGKAFPSSKRPIRLETVATRRSGRLGDTYLTPRPLLDHKLTIHAAYEGADGKVWAVPAESSEYQIAGVSDMSLLYGRENGSPDWKVVFRADKVSFSLRDVVFSEKEAAVYVVGEGGAVWRFTESTKKWAPVTRGALPGDRVKRANDAAKAGASYWRLPPPWTYLLFAFSLAWLAFAVVISAVPAANTLAEVAAQVDSPGVQHDSAPGVARFSVSDRPIDENDEDRLGFRPVARGVAGFLRNPKTQLPVTLAINGDWGTGKSSLMNLICGDLRRAGFRPVWFNAWHHQEDENLLASLLQSVRGEAAPPILSKGGLGFRTRLGWLRFVRYYPRALAMIAIFLAVWAAESWYDKKDNAPQLKRYFAELDLEVKPPRHEAVPGAKPSENTEIAPSTNQKEANQAAPAENEARKSKQEAPVPAPSLLVMLLGLLGSLHALLDGASATVGTKPLAAFYLLVRIFPSALSRLKAFTENPASLLYSAAPGASQKQIEAQTSFRMRFAKEFTDVTKALGKNHRLVIFVDDLDRCRPSNVAEMLEAINYVTVSGECAFILGLETNAVRAALGLRFDDIAQEVEPTRAKAAGNGGNKGAEKDDFPDLHHQNRDEFARRYIEKLINVELNVPELDLQRKQALFASDDTARPKDDPIARAKQIARIGSWLEPVALFLLVLAVGWGVGRGLVRFAEWRAGVHFREQTAQKPAIEPGAGTGGSQTGKDTQGGQNSQVAQDQLQTNAELPSADPNEEKIPAELSGENPLPRAWLRTPWFWIVLTFASLVVVRLLAREPIPPAKDSPEFGRALAAWSWVADMGLSTPRATKRFLNRLRFLAMRQHPPSVQLPGLIKVLLSAEEQKRAIELEEGELDAGPGVEPIPDGILVALASLEIYPGRQPVREEETPKEELARKEYQRALDAVAEEAVFFVSRGNAHAEAFLAELARLAGNVSSGPPIDGDPKSLHDFFVSLDKGNRIANEVKDWSRAAGNVISASVGNYTALQGSVEFT